MLYKDITVGKLRLKGNVFIAPLAGYTNLPTRLIYRSLGASICYAEMVSAEGLNYSYNKSVKLIDTDPSDTPLGVQIFGQSPERIEKAFSRIINEKFDLIDLNCGCSVKKVIKSFCGAYLLQNPENIGKIIKILKNMTDKPVTLKIRSGWDNSHINYKEVYQAAAESGADLITLHPRTKSMLFDGKADWSHITELKKISRIPVIGNGDIFSGDDAVRMMNETRCDGVMLARGVMENPFLIGEVISAFTGEVYHSPDIRTRLEAALKHMNDLIAYLGVEKGILEFRKFFRGYCKGMKNIAIIRQKINETVDIEEIRGIILHYADNYCD